MCDLWLFFLLLLLPQTVLRAANIKNVRKVRICHNSIPQSDHFIHGYDVTQFDILVCEDNLRRLKIVDVQESCTDGTKFRLNDANKTEFDVPDGMIASAEPDFEEELSYKHVENINELFGSITKPSLPLPHENATDLGKGLFGSSSIVSPIYLELNFTASANITKYSQFKLHLPYTESRKHLSSEFKTMVRKLPLTFFQNEKHYLGVVKRFGTHILSAATFGGINGRFVIQYRNESKERFLRNGECQSEALRGVFQRRTVNVQSNNRYIGQVIRGGVLRSFRTPEYKEWIELIKSFPALISADLVPISYLVNDEQKSSSLLHAIRTYIMTAYERFYKKSLTDLLNTGCFAPKETEVAKSNYGSITDENKYNASFLETVGDELRDQFLRLWQTRDIQCLKNVRVWKNEV